MIFLIFFFIKKNDYIISNNNIIRDAKFIHKKNNMATFKKCLIRVYWDIENIPPGKYPERFLDELYTKLKNIFGDDFAPPFITVVCNVNRIRKNMAEFLCKNGVTITHIPGVKTEEADRKIEQFIHHDLHHSFNSHYVVITHDNDFVSILREMQQRSSKNSKIIYTRLNKNGNKCTKALERMATHTINLNIDIISPPKKKSNIVSTSNVKVVENKKKNNIVVTQPAKTTKSVVVTQPVKIESDTNKKTLTKKVSSETTKKSIFNTSIKKLAKAISDATVSKVSDKKCNDYYIGSPIIFAPSQMIFI